MDLGEAMHIVEMRKRKEVAPSSLPRGWDHQDQAEYIAPIGNKPNALALSNRLAFF
jgi:hypothetical protein